LTRSRAGVLLERIVARAAQINADPITYPVGVRRLLVFGSYLSDKDPIGDIDIGVETVLVRLSGDFMQERPRWRLIHWENKTHVALQVRNPSVVSIHRVSEVLSLCTHFQEIFLDPAVHSPPVPQLSLRSRR
jgi:hypothetical protein